MKRSIKNVLMVAVIALLSIGMIFTYSYAKKHITDNTFASMNGGTPPSMPSNSNEGNGNNSGSDSKKSSCSNEMMPPDNNNNNNNSQSRSQSTPPAKPSDDNGTPPVKPDGDNTATSNSKITTNKGDTLYVTNTKATITLENNTIVNNDTTGNFLRVQKDSWGNSGSNGGDVTLNLTKQKVTGNIVIDSISTLSMSLTNSSSYEGTINKDNGAKMISLTLDKTSKLKLTGDSYITSLNNEDSSNSNIDFNGYKLYVNGALIN